MEAAGAAAAAGTREDVRAGDGCRGGAAAVAGLAGGVAAGAECDKGGTGPFQRCRTCVLISCFKEASSMRRRRRILESSPAMTVAKAITTLAGMPAPEVMLSSSEESPVRERVAGRLMQIVHTTASRLAWNGSHNCRIDMFTSWEELPGRAKDAAQ